MAQLTLLRHGQSTYNLENRFTGNVDAPLTPLGEEEARLAKVYKIRITEPCLTIDRKLNQS